MEACPSGHALKRSLPKVGMLKKDACPKLAGLKMGACPKLASLKRKINIVFVSTKRNIKKDRQSCAKLCWIRMTYSCWPGAVGQSLVLILVHSANRGRVQNKISGFERRVEKSCLKGNWIELLSSVKWNFQLEREKCKRKINEMFCLNVLEKSKQNLIFQANGFTCSPVTPPRQWKPG